MTEAKKHNGQLRTAAALCVMLAAEMVYAADHADSRDNEGDSDRITSLLDLSLEELVELRVSVSTNSERKITRAPSSVTAITDSEIRRQGFDNLEDILNYIPGVFSNRSDLGNNAPVFRGRFTEQAAPDIVLLIDGFRMNDPVTGAAFDVTSDLSLINLSQLEVVRGPGSAIYGSSAMSGVISLTTHDEGNAVNIRGGTQGSMTAAMRYGDTIGATKVSAFVRGHQSDGFEYQPFFDFFGESQVTRDPVQAMDASLKIAFGAVSLDSLYLYRRDEGFLAGGGLNPVTDQLRTERDNFHARLRYAPQISEDLSLSFSASYQQVHYDFTTILAPAALAAVAIWADGSLLDNVGGNVRTSDSLTLEALGVWQPDEKHRLQFGLTGRHESTGDNPFQGNWDTELNSRIGAAGFVPFGDGTQINRGFFGGFGIPFTSEGIFLIRSTSREVFGAYLQDEWAATDRLDITVGVRYDWYEDAGSKLSFRGGLVYGASSDTTFKLLYGQAFRAPTLFEQQGERASNFLGNPTLRPEVIDTVEGAIEQRIGSLKFGLTYYYSRVRDAIQRVLVDDIVAGFNAFQPTNTDSAIYHGLEAELAGRLSPSLDLRASFSHAFEADETAVARTLGSLILHYQRGNWQINLSGNYRSSILSRTAELSVTEEPVRLAAAVIVNAKLGYFLSENLELSLRSQNIFDRDYYTFSPQARLDAGLPAAARSVEVGLTYEF